MPLPEGFEIIPEQAQQTAGTLPPGFELEQFSDRFGSFSQPQPGMNTALQAKAEELRGPTGTDMLKSAGVGLGEGLIHGAGFSGDARDLIIAGLKKLGFEDSTIKTFIPKMLSLAPTSKQIKDVVQEKTGEFYEPKTTAGEYARTVGQFAPNIASGPIGAGRGAVTKGVQVVRDALSRSVIPAVTSETAGQATKGTALEPWARLGGAVAGGVLPTAVSRTVSPFQASPDHTKFVKLLESEGVKATAGQSTGSRFLKVAESEIGGAKAARMAEQQGEQFTAAVMKRLDENVTRVTPQILKDVRDRLGNTFERVAKNLPVKHGKQLGDDLTAIAKSVFDEGLPVETVNRIMKQMENVANGFVTQTKGHALMSGANYQALTRKNTPLARAIDDRDPNISHYASRIRDALDGALERTAKGQGTQPGKGRQLAFEQLSKAREQWRTVMVVQKAMSRAGEGTAKGLISPQALRGALDETEYVLGRGKLSELARAGEAVLKPVATSETAIRSSVRGTSAGMGTLAGMGMFGGAEGGILGGALGLVGPWVAGRTMMTRPVQNYLSNQAVTPSAPGMSGRNNALMQLITGYPREFQP